MDDSIFVDLVIALVQYEREDKDKEHTRKGKEKEDGKDKDKDTSKKDSNGKGEWKIEKTTAEEAKSDKSTTPFPSMHIFNVRSGQLFKQFILFPFSSCSTDSTNNLFFFFFQ